MYFFPADGVRAGCLFIQSDNPAIWSSASTAAAVVVCGHTHMQFDRMVGTTRVVNAGSVGAPFGEPGAYWVRLGPDIQLRRTSYNFAQAAELLRDTLRMRSRFR